MIYQDFPPFFIIFHHFSFYIIFLDFLYNENGEKNEELVEGKNN
jgi:hypothetical protein